MGKLSKESMTISGTISKDSFKSDFEHKIAYSIFSCLDWFKIILFSLIFMPGILVAVYFRISSPGKIKNLELFWYK